MPMDVFDCGVVLFDSQEDEEDLRVECVVTPEGALEILQESDGPITWWCFEESPHRIEAVVEPMGLEALMGYFHVDEPWQLPAILRLEYTGYDCFSRIRALLRRLVVPYAVYEAPIAR